MKPHPTDEKLVQMIKGGKVFRNIEANCWSPEQRIAEMDRWNVDVQVLCTVPVMFSYSEKPEHALSMSQYLNDDIMKTVNAYPKRFIGLGTIPMQSPELAIAELRRCMEMGMVGVQIGSHVNEWNLDQPELFAIFEECARLGAAVFIHPWDMMGAERMQKYWLPWLVGMPAETTLAICSMIFGGVFERLPKLRVCFGHGGGSFPQTLGRIEHGFNCRPDLVQVDNQVNPREYLGKFWVDSIVHDHDVLTFLVNLMGEDYVIFGTDYPFPLGEVPEAGKLIETHKLFSPELKRKLLSTNCLRFLNSKAEQYL